MQNKLELNIVSPMSLVVSEEVAMVVAPGIDGYFGILANHMPFLTVLRPGVIEIFNDKDTRPARTFFVEGGVAEVNNQGCALLVDSAIDCGDITSQIVADRQANLDRNSKNMSSSERERQLEVIGAMERVVSDIA